MRRALFAHVLATGFLLFASACPATHVERPYPAPTAAVLLATVQAKNNQVRTLRARTKMDHFDQGAGQRVKGDVLVLVELPDKLHFHAVSPMGTPLATLTSDGSAFSLFDADQNRFFTGPSDPCNIGRLTGIAMDGASVASVLIGGTPLLSFTEADESWDDKQGNEVLTLKAADGSAQTVELAGDEPEGGGGARDRERALPRRRRRLAARQDQDLGAGEPRRPNHRLGEPGGEPDLPGERVRAAAARRSRARAGELRPGGADLGAGIVAAAARPGARARLERERPTAAAAAVDSDRAGRDH